MNEIIQGLRGVQPINNDIDIEVDEQLVNNDKMASHSQVMFGNNISYYPLANEVPKGYSNPTVRPSFRNILVNTRINIL